MQFSGVLFLFFFFPVAVLCYYVSKKINTRLADICLLCVSLLFYSWTCVDDVFKLLFFICYVYLIGLVFKVFSLHKEDKKLKRTCIVKVVCISICSILFILFIYKYLNFFIDTVNGLIGTGVAHVSLIAPLGISYIIFSAISYLVDIYRGDAESTSFLDAALYLTFFPKVASGPIALYKDFSKNIIKKPYDLDNIVSGLNRLVIGFAKKVILADYFGEVLSRISNVDIDPATAILTIVIYSFQLYMDFDGYTDMAIGLGRIFGYSLPENFDLPYISTSITEFWRRWHISLGNFFKNYIYIPLGGNRKGKIRTLINLMVVFLATGVWHGAGFNYIIWGASHGVCVVVERLSRNTAWYTKTPKIIKWLFTITVVFVGWQFFRFEDLAGFAQLFSNIFNPVNVSEITFTWQYYLSIKLIFMLVLTACLSLGLFRKLKNWLCKLSVNPKLMFSLKQVSILALFILSIISTVSSGYSPFIYFRY